MDKWNAKIAVVTGASAGIGAEIVRDFAKNGIVVIGLARRVEKVEAIAKELGDTTGKIHAHYCDVSDRRSIEEAFKWIEDGFGVVHILINNAGVGTKTKILSDDYNDGDKLEKVINTNFSGLLHVTRAAYSLMNKSNDYGIIVNINSVVGHIVPFPADGESHSSIYPGTKFAVSATTEVIRQELACSNKKKIRVSSVSPGVVETDFFHASQFLTEDQKISNFAPALTASDVSNAVLYLLSTPYHVNISELTIRPQGERF